VGINDPEVFTEITVEAQVWASRLQKCLPKSQFRLKRRLQYSRSVYQNHSLGSSVGLNTPEVFTEITVWVQARAAILQKYLPESQLRLKCGPQYSRSVYRNHSLGSSVGLNTPEVFTEITVEAQVWALMLQKCLPKRYFKLKCGSQSSRHGYRNHSLGSSVGINIPEVFTEMAV